MGVQLRYGTAGATGGGFSAQPGTLQPAFDESRHEPRWSYQSRGPKTWKDRTKWFSLWSYGCRVGYGGVSGEDGASMCDLTVHDMFEPYSCDGEGSPQSRFIRGNCVDASDVAVANPIVQAFRTSDDAFMGEAQANTDGTYIVPVGSVAGVAHYLVAYKAGSPDIAGTTVNTITNTNVDGT